MTCVPAHMLPVHLFVEATHTHTEKHTPMLEFIFFGLLVSNKLRLDTHFMYTHMHTQHGHTKSQTDNGQVSFVAVSSQCVFLNCRCGC